MQRSRKSPKSAPAGILRSALVGREPARTIQALFSNLGAVSHGAVIGDDTDGETTHREFEGARLRLDRTDGHGSYEFFRLYRHLFIVTIECLYDRHREEIVAGEGLIEFHICLRGRLTMQLPKQRAPVVVQGPCLLMLYQPVGVDLTERLEAGVRHTGLSLYCRPSFLTELLRRNGITQCELPDAVQAHTARTVWHKTVTLAADLHYSATGLLQNPYQGGFRLLHAEAKAIEILCKVLSPATQVVGIDGARGNDTVVGQLDAVRRVLSTQFAPIPHIRELARRVGMSESRLKRSFKEHFGTTIFEYGMEHRMRHALELLRASAMSICQVAEEAGYQHQTSFTAAFRDHFGFLPSDARRGAGALSA
jgi:AraC-like DNA-binding protein